MTATHRITVWLISSILMWGGCAAPALKQTPTTTLEAAVSNPEPQAASVPSRMVAAEAALIRQTALERGFSEDEAERIEESVLEAQPQHRQFLTRYIHALNRYQEGDLPAEELSEAPPSPTTSPLESANVVAPATLQSSRRKAVGSAVATQPTDQRSPSASAAPVRTVARTTGAPATEIELPPDDADGHLPLEEREARPTANESSSGAVRHSLRDDPVVVTAVSANNTTRLDSRHANPASPDNLGPEIDEGVDRRDDERVSWQREVRSAIARLHDELNEREEGHLDPLDETRMRACLSLLQLATDDPEKAMETLDGLDDHQLEFWRQTLMGLGILIDPEELPKMRYRVETAVEHLDSGLAALSSLGPLRVKNLAFVKNVRSFGVYTETGSRGFEPGEETLLYVEIENYQVEEVSPDTQDLGSARSHTKAADVPMYEAELLGRYDILEGNQPVMPTRVLPVLKDQCRQRRRDFFGVYALTIPKLAPGDYLLELTMEDKKGGKFGSGTIDFRIR